MTDKLPEVGQRYIARNNPDSHVLTITEIHGDWVRAVSPDGCWADANFKSFLVDYIKIPEEEQNEWQPIETAPKEKYLLVISITSDHQPCVGYYGKSNIDLPEDWFSDLLNMARTPLPYVPTHWMPLPKPPVDNNK